MDGVQTGWNMPKNQWYPKYLHGVDDGGFSGSSHPFIYVFSRLSQTFMHLLCPDKHEQERRF